MAGLKIQAETVAGRLMLRLDGSFDRDTALELTRSLKQAAAGQDVVLDFSHVRQFQDAAVAVLGMNLANSHVSLTGLGTHQQRMFQIFGMATDRATTQSRGYYTPEEVLGL